jgi:hypothetical protein
VSPHYSIQIFHLLVVVVANYLQSQMGVHRARYHLVEVHLDHYQVDQMVHRKLQILLIEVEVAYSQQQVVLVEVDVRYS